MLLDLTALFEQLQPSIETDAVREMDDEVAQLEKLVDKLIGTLEAKDERGRSRFIEATRP